MRVRRVAAWLGLVRQADRQRRMSLDRMRVLSLCLAAMLFSAIAAFAWTWQTQRQGAAASAAQALKILELRLDTIGAELQHLAAHPDLQVPSLRCTESLVDALIELSLGSMVIRRVEVVPTPGSPRCGPRGAAPNLHLLKPPSSGLSLELGQDIAMRPHLLYALPHGAALQATLHPNALQLQASEMVDMTAAHKLRIALMTAGAGEYRVWGPRGAKPDTAGTPEASGLLSDKHPLGVSARLIAAPLWQELFINMVWAALLALTGTSMLISLIWRRALLRSRLVHRLARALRKRQFEPFVQPIVRLSDGRCVGGEVLMRWRHPQRGIVGPTEFIEEAERTGLILGMSYLCMSLAAHRLASLSHADPKLYFSFNVTPGQLREPDFERRLAEIFRPDTLRKEQVLLELTERELVDPVAMGKLVALRAAGWKIAIDDFGTGQSSLASIERLPIDRIKIDRAFVSTVNERTVSRPVLDAIIGLARELGVPLIAEGIETRAQWDYLASRGVAYAQGYLMARPMPIPDLLRWWDHHTAQSADSFQSGGAIEQSAQTARAAAPATAVEIEPALQALWQRMASAQGVEQRNRYHRLRRYQQCFIGSQALDWIQRSQGVARAEALRQARALLAVGLVQHVAEEHDFEDGEFFYRLAPQTSVGESRPAPETAAVRQALHRALDLDWTDRRRGLLRHRRCASGRTLVDWIARHYATPRGTALEWANQLMAQGTLRHVFDDQPVRDDASLYRLS